MIRTVCILWLLVLLVGGSELKGADPASSGLAGLDQLVVALRPDMNPDAMVSQRNALVKHLEAEGGITCQVIVPLSGAVIQQGLRNGSIDLAFISATDMILAKDRAEILLAVEIEGRAWYESYWVTLKEQPYRSVEDLKGRRVAFSSRTSTSGYVIPAWDMHERGLVARAQDLEAFFGRNNVWFGSGYVSAVEQVLRGEAAAAAVSYYVLDKDRHLNEEQRSRLRKLQTQGPVPTHVLAISSRLSEEAKQALRTVFLQLNEPENEELRDSLFTNRLIEVGQKSHLAPLEAAMNFVRP